MAPEFKQMVDYCRSDEASKEGLLSLMQTEAGEFSLEFIFDIGGACHDCSTS